jgi:hypothetical protein
MMQLDTEHRILCLAARTSVEPAQGQALGQLLRGPVDWERLWAQGHLHEVLPLLGTTLRRFSSTIAIPAAWQERARRRLYATMVRNTTLADALTEVIGAFGQAGVEVIPVKGIVLAETLYGGLALRSLGDLDVLVRPADLPAARTVLRALGYAQADEPGFDNAHHMFHDPPYFHGAAGGRVCLELHWGLWASRFFRIGTEPLWQRSTMGRLRGADVRLLSAEDTLLHLAIHRSRSALRLRFVCDIAELLRCHSERLDWGYVLEQAAAAGARTALYYALALAQELLDAPLPPGILARLGVGQIKRRLLDQTCGTAALFRPAAAGDLSQQPALMLRVLEQDGIGHIAWVLGATLARKSQKQLYNYGLRRRPSE